LESKLTKVEALLARFKRFRTDHAKERIADFATRVSALKASWQEFRERGRAFERDTATRFNIFQVLKLERREVTTHSRLIRELLDPEGSHGQRCLFLQNFLNVCWEKRNRPYEFPRIESSVENARWLIECEPAILTSMTDDEMVRPRRLDLKVKSSALGFMLVIENKVDAGDIGDDQVEDYLGWLDHQPLPLKGLVYLTPSGIPSPTAGKRTDYLCLSYKQDIVHWLERSLRDACAPRVRDLVSQYLEVVSDL
jgi:hypothetical protein